MYKILFIFSTVLVNFQFHPSKYKCPFTKGVAIRNNIDDLNGITYTNPDYSIKVIGRDSLVLSVSETVIKKIIKFDDKFDVISESNGYYFTYQGIDSLLIKENDIISVQSIIGYSYSKSIFLKISHGINDIKLPEKLLDCKCRKMKENKSN